MLPLIAVLLACGAPVELAEPSPPPDPWPMSRAVLAASAQAGGVATEDAATVEAPADAAPAEEPPADPAPADEALSPGAPSPAEGTRPEPP